MSEQDLAGWNALEALARPSLKDLFGDPERLARYSTELELPGGPIRFDWSKTHLSPDVERVLGEIAGTMDLVGKREQLFAGARINNTEGRAAEHAAQRGVGSDASVEEAGALHARMRALVDAIHAGVLGEVKSLIHIGIGGSALGPALAIDALAREARSSTCMSSRTSMVARWKPRWPPAIRRRR
jgi:glucose-6-phosphate isomerase